MADLPEPDFVDQRDPSIVLAACISFFETQAGRPLTPAQVERILIDLIAYRESLLREQIQDAAKQNLWRWARFPMADLLAEIVNAPRLDPIKATALFQCTIPVQATDKTIGAGKQIRSNDGNVVFELDEDVVIVAGDTTAPAVNGTCTTPGLLGNGYIAGQVSDVVVPEAFDLAIVNTTTTGGGAPQETTERFKSRVPNAVKAFSCAGPEGAYVFYSLSAHPDVLDVDVSTPTAGVVRLTLLIRDGADEPTVTAAVTAAVNAEDVRPVTDTVELAVADPVDYVLAASFVLKKGAKWSEVEPLLDAAWAAYQDTRPVRLGAEPVLSQIYAALAVAGVHAITITSPIGLVVDDDEWARCTDTDFTFGGFE